MTKYDKILLLHFITRTGLYITTEDKSNVVSFITGYEMGVKTCDFSNAFKSFVMDKFKIKSDATGWPGQIQMLSEKLSQNWLRTFKQVTLQFITGNETTDLNEDLNKTIKTRLQGLVERIDENGNPWFNEWWTEEWQSLCLLSFDWFKQLWTCEQLKAVQAIDKAVSSKKVFADKDKKIPTKELIELRQQFNI
jgi:hypothetical protein